MCLEAQLSMLAHCQIKTQMSSKHRSRTMGIWSFLRCKTVKMLVSSPFNTNRATAHTSACAGIITNDFKYGMAAFLHIHYYVHRAIYNAPHRKVFFTWREHKIMIEVIRWFVFRVKHVII